MPRPRPILPPRPDLRRRHRPARRHSAAFPDAPHLADRARRVVGAARAVVRLGDRAVHPRRRRLGPQHPGQLGLRDPQLRLVARHRPCRHADLGAAAAARPRLAQFAQPLRRDDDAVRRGLRRHLSDPASRPAVVLLLDVSLSGDDGRVAAVPQPARMGHLGGADLSHRLGRVLVHRPRARSRRGARPRAAARLAGLLRRARRSAGAARRCTGCAGTRPIGCSRRSPCRWSSRCTARCRCCSPPAPFPAGIRRSSRPISCSAPPSPASPWWR